MKFLKQARATNVIFELYLAFAFLDRLLGKRLSGTSSVSRHLKSKYIKLENLKFKAEVN